MKTQSVPPTGISQDFEINESFFSTTDPRGIIKSGNRVFTRTSGYSIEELIGSPHNLIRHPDIPRCVFSMLWKRVKANRPFSGYVKNQAKNGNHYWVFALIEPVDGELLSIRIKPSCHLFEKIGPVYAKLVSIEESELNSGNSPQAAAEASEAALLSELATLGFEDYDAFSQHCLNLEIKSRDQIIENRKLQLLPPFLEGQHQDRFHQASGAYAKLSQVFSSIDDFLSLADNIKAEQKSVAKLADHFRNYALNANIAANQFGRNAATIGTITQFLHNHANSFSSNATDMANLATATNKMLMEINSRLASARIQLEMLINFLAEASQILDETSQKKLSQNLDSLEAAFSSTARQATEALTQLDLQLPELIRKKDDLLKAIISFSVAQTSGLIECSRLENADDLTSMFEEFRKQIEDARSQIDDSYLAVSNLKRLAKTTPKTIQSVLRSLTSSSQSEPLAC